MEVIVTLRLAISGEVLGEVRNGLQMSSSLTFLSDTTSSNSSTKQTNTTSNNIPLNDDR